MKNDYLSKGRTGQKQKTREKILQAAKEIQGEKAEFNLENVAKRAGISRATIYRYYSNRDILSAEAVLDMRTRTPEQILSEFSQADLETTLLGIQRYYNDLAIKNEKAFRKYLSVILNPENPVSARGARRIRTLSKALEDKKSSFSNRDQQRLIYMATLMMGIEAFIVTRDVCQLDEESAEEVLEWGLKTMIKGLRCTAP
jgi:AcrR family transcriptional regulator